MCCVLGAVRGGESENRELRRRLREDTWAKTFEEGRIGQKGRLPSPGAHEPRLSVKTSMVGCRKQRPWRTFVICVYTTSVNTIPTFWQFPTLIPTFLGQKPEYTFPDSFTAGGQAYGLESSKEVDPRETQIL